MLTISKCISRSLANGPGSRVVVFFSGCTIQCPGCHNRLLWDRAAGTECSPDNLASLVCTMMVLTRTNRLTLSGGEPTEQDPEEMGRFLLALQQRMLSEGLGDLDLIVFSGRGASDFTSNLSRETAWANSWASVIVAGPYIAELAVSDGLLSSSNQTYVILRGHYTERSFTRIVEVRVCEDEVVVTGFPGNAFIEETKEQ